MPILCAMAPLTNRRIAMSTRHIMRKPTFINIDNRTPFKRVMPNNRLEDTPCDGACFGMVERFFYS
jgi:hypothetical protein